MKSGSWIAGGFAVVAAGFIVLSDLAAPAARYANQVPTWLRALIRLPDGPVLPHPDQVPSLEKIVGSLMGVPGCSDGAAALLGIDDENTLRQVLDALEKVVNVVEHGNPHSVDTALDILKKRREARLNPEFPWSEKPSFFEQSQLRAEITLIQRLQTLSSTTDCIQMLRAALR